MGYLQREIVTYGSAWMAMLAMVAGTLYLLWTARRDQQVLFVDGAVLHAHFDEIHAHRHGEIAHWHDAAGQRVLISH